MNRPLRIFVLVSAFLCIAPLARADVSQELLASKNLTPKEVADLEARVIADPDDMSAHVKLLGHYFLCQSGPADQRKLRRKHVLWVIEKHPESELASLPYVQFHPSLDPDGYAAAKQLWLGHTNEHPTNTAILGNAASFFVLADSEQAERLLLEAQKLEPKNPEWANRLGHLYALNRGSSEEETRTSALKSLEQYERSYQNAATREARFYGLSDLAKAAFEVGDLPKATQYANELVVMAADFPRDWNYGNAIHHGNLILGRVALRKGEVDRASDFLLKAGRTPGSPQLNSFGPNMALAKELLEKQQQKAVLEYFELCRKFWGMHADSLDRWKTDVEAGRTPDFGGNLVY